MKLSGIASNLINTNHLNQLQEQVLPHVGEIEVSPDEYAIEPRQISSVGQAVMAIKPDFLVTWEMQDKDFFADELQGVSKIASDNVEQVLHKKGLSLEDVVALVIHASTDADGSQRLFTSQSLLKEAEQYTGHEFSDIGIIYALKENFKFAGLRLTEAEKQARRYEELAYQVDYLDRFLNNAVYEVSIFEADDDGVARRGSIINDKYFEDVVEELIMEYNDLFSPAY